MLDDVLDPQKILRFKFLNVDKAEPTAVAFRRMWLGFVTTCPKPYLNPTGSAQDLSPVDWFVESWVGRRHDACRCLVDSSDGRAEGWTLGGIFAVGY